MCLESTHPPHIFPPPFHLNQLAHWLVARFAVSYKPRDDTFQPWSASLDITQTQTILANLSSWQWDNGHLREVRGLIAGRPSIRGVIPCTPSRWQDGNYFELLSPVTSRTSC